CRQKNRKVSERALRALGRVLINAGICRMSALGANRTRRDGGNDVNDPTPTWAAKNCRCPWLLMRSSNDRLSPSKDPSRLLYCRSLFSKIAPHESDLPFQWLV